MLLDSAREQPFVIRRDYPTGRGIVPRSVLGEIRVGEALPDFAGRGRPNPCVSHIPEDVLNAPHFLTEAPNPVSAQALEASSMILIPIANFESLMSSYPEVALQLVPILAMRLRDLLNTVEDFSFRKVSSRLAKLLLQLGERQDVSSAVSTAPPLTQHHLACVVGCSRQVLNKYLQELSGKVSSG